MVGMVKFFLSIALIGYFSKVFDGDGWNSVLYRSGLDKMCKRTH